MNESDRERYRERYRSRLTQYGHDPRSLGWKSGRQALRFDAVLSTCQPGAVSSVLDVGCGFGDLFAHLRSGGYTGRYTGIDFIPELVEVGKTAYPDADLRVADLADLPGDERFDLVVSVGIFNAKLRHEDQWSHVSNTFRAMFARCQVVTVADFLSSYVDWQEDDVNYTSPEQVFSLAKQLTRRVRLAHDYLPFEFLVAAYRNDRVAEDARFGAP